MVPKSQHTAITETSETQSEMEVRTPTRVDRFAEYMALRAQQDESDNESSGMEGIMERMLAVENPEDLWDSDEGGIPAGKDIVDIEQRILSCEVFKGKGNPDDDIVKNNKIGKTYLIIRSARLDNGEEFIWNTSAPLVVVKLMRFDQFGKLPLDCVVRSTDLGGGKGVLKLRPIQARAI